MKPFAIRNLAILLLTFVAPPWIDLIAADSSELQGPAAPVDNTRLKSALRAHLSFLADDLLEGRGTGTRGYDLAAHYVATQFERLGLQPGGPSNTWFQTVPLLESKISAGGTDVSFFHAGGEVKLAPEEDYLMWPDPFRLEGSIRLNQSFSFEGAADFVRLNAALVARIADGPDRPSWNSGDFFARMFAPAPAAPISTK